MRSAPWLAFLAAVSISLLVFFTAEIKIIFSWSQIGTASGWLLCVRVYVCVSLIYADPAFFFSQCNLHLFSAVFLLPAFLFGPFGRSAKLKPACKHTECVCVCVYLFLEFYFILAFRLAHAAIISSINKPPELALKGKRASDCEHFLFIVCSVYPLQVPDNGV